MTNHTTRSTPSESGTAGIRRGTITAIRGTGIHGTMIPFIIRLTHIRGEDTTAATTEAIIQDTTTIRTVRTLTGITARRARPA